MFLQECSGMVLWMESSWIPEVLWVTASVLLDVTELHHLLQEVWVAIISMRFHGMVQGLTSLLLLSEEIGDQILHVIKRWLNTQACKVTHLNRHQVGKCNFDSSCREGAMRVLLFNWVCDASITP